MPLPSPKGKEKQSAFVSRCLSNPTIQREFGKGTEQAQAVCFDRWRSAKKK